MTSAAASYQQQTQDSPWREKCSFGCYHAKGKKKKCRCRCGGKLHGRAHEEHNEKLRIDEQEEQNQP